jgi:uncharacterized protein (TIGR02145 family)
MYNGCVKILGFLVFSASLVSCLALSSSVFATDPSSSATATVHVSEACSLTSSVITPHTDNMGNGTYTDSLGSTKFTVKCNDASGFALYAIGYSGDEYGATSMLGDNELSIPTGTDTSAGNTTSHWSMKISKDTTSYLPNSLTIENSFDGQHLIPSTYTKIASFPSSTDGINGTGTSILATYGVRISGTQAAGTYIGKVKYTLVHPNMVNNENKPPEPLQATDCPANSICYAPNSPDIKGSMSSLGTIAASYTAGKQTKDNLGSNAGWNNGNTITSNTTAVVLIAPNFRRAGYGFAGWSTDYEANNESKIYGPNETISTDASNGGIDLSVNGLILYPVWIASSGNLQNWSSCSSLTPVSYNSETGQISANLNSVTALTDTRDDNVYTVARLSDGKCWMVENLRLSAEDSRGDANITKSQGYATSQTYGDFIGLADSENNFGATGLSPTAANNSTNSLYSADGSTLINIGDFDSPAYRMPRYNNDCTNDSLQARYDEPSAADHYQWYGYGNYYSWAAAMASTKYYYGFYDDNNGEQYNSDAAGTSICPLGWKLPLGATSTGDISQGANDSTNRVGSFSYLDRTMGGTGQDKSNNTITNDSMSIYFRKFPQNITFGSNLVYADIAHSSHHYHGGSYWTSSAYPTPILFTGLKAFSVRISPTNLFVEATSKTSGLSVRCVAQ